MTPVGSFDGRSQQVVAVAVAVAVDDVAVDDVAVAVVVASDADDCSVRLRC